MRLSATVLIVLLCLALFPGPALAQETEIYDYSSVGNDDYYNPTEYMGDGGNYESPPSIEMEVSDEYRPDGYYEPYDFSYIPQPGQPVNIGEPDPALPPDTPLPGDEAPVYDPAAYGQDTYVPEPSPPVYVEPLQAEMEDASAPVTDIPADEPPTPAALPVDDKTPVRFLVGIQRSPRRFLVVHPALTRSLTQALLSSNETDWLALNNEIVKIYADLSSSEPSYPELYEEFERVNSVLISFIFSGAFGAREGAILKWNDQLFAIVGPLSTRIRVRPVKMSELMEKLVSVLGGRLRRSLEDGTRYVDLSSLTAAVERIMKEVGEGNLQRVKVLAGAVGSAGERLRKLLGPFLHLLRAKFQLEADQGRTPYRQALDVLPL